MAKAILPDYQNCGMNVASAVLNHFGAVCHQEQHPCVKQLLDAKTYKNVVIMLFDGLGMQTLSDHLSEDTFLRTHVMQSMTAVFPSTTVAATTSIESGEAPCEHAWLGWSMYFKDMDRTVDVFLDRDTDTGEFFGGNKSVGFRYMPYRNICQKLEGHVKAHIVSRYGTDRIDTLDEMLETAAKLCHAEGRRYIYTYWAEPDHTMHEKGVTAVGEIVREIDEKVRLFCENAGDDTLVMVTADHGLLDCEMLYVEHHPEIRNMCVRRTSVEARVTAFFLRPECLGDFPAAFEKAFGTEHFWLLKSEDAVNMGLFGPGKEHKLLRSFLGDYLAIATDKYSIGWDYDPHPLVGMHAGMTAREMYVPLIVGKE